MPDDDKGFGLSAREWGAILGLTALAVVIVIVAFKLGIPALVDHLIEQCLSQVP